MTDAGAVPSSPLTHHARASLPRGRHALSRDVIQLSQRARLLDAIVRSVAEKGYGAATVADALQRARVSRATFYELFADKEDCFLAAYEAGSRLLRRSVLEAIDLAGDDWLLRMRAGVRAYLRVLSDEPAYGVAFLVEVQAAGPRAAERRAEWNGRYAELIRETYGSAQAQIDGLPDLPGDVFLATVAAENEMVRSRLAGDASAGLMTLEPLMMYVELSMFGLHEHARAALAEAREGREGRRRRRT